MNVDALKENGFLCEMGMRVIKTHEVEDTRVEQLKWPTMFNELAFSCLVECPCISNI